MVPLFLCSSIVLLSLCVFTVMNTQSVKRLAFEALCVVYSLCRLHTDCSWNVQDSSEIYLGSALLSPGALSGCMDWTNSRDMVCVALFLHVQSAHTFTVEAV